MIRRLCLATVLALVACRADPDERAQTLARAGRVDSIIAHGPVVRDLRSPPESTRIIYTRPTPLALPVATAAGAGRVAAPYGISPPDTSRAGARPRGGAPTPPRRTPGPPTTH